MLQGSASTDFPVFFPGPAPGLTSDAYAVVVSASDQATFLSPAPAPAEVSAPSGLYGFIIPGAFLTTPGTYYIYVSYSINNSLAYSDYLVIS